MCVEDTLIIGTARYDSCQKVFSAAGEFAVRQSLAAGLPLTYVSGTEIIKEFTDGSKVVLGSVEPSVIPGLISI